MDLKQQKCIFQRNNFLSIKGEKLSIKIEEIEASIVANFLVTLLHVNQTIKVQPNELILDAAIRQGVNLFYSCRGGTCRTCMLEVVEGEVVQQDADGCMISEQELTMNRRLICMSTVQSHAILDKVKRLPSVTVE